MRAYVENVKRKVLHSERVCHLLAGVEVIDGVSIRNGIMRLVIFKCITIRRSINYLPIRKINVMHISMSSNKSITYTGTI